MGVEMESKIDCPRCGKKLACPWDRVCYYTPCEECRDSQAYKDEQKDLNRYRGNPYRDAELRKPAGVWNYKGKHVVTDGRGDIIDSYDARPRDLGKPGEVKRILDGK